MANKPRVRVKAGQSAQREPAKFEPNPAGEEAPTVDSKPIATLHTTDSFTNLAAKLGVTGDNLTSSNTYGFNPISRNRTLLEWMYRGAWMCGVAVDCVAEDMTRAGVEFGSTLDPDAEDKLHRAMQKFNVWPSLCESIKWARLYGGSLAVMMIDGHDPSEPLEFKTKSTKGDTDDYQTVDIEPGSFQGLMVLDKWMLQPVYNEFISDFGPEFGLPLKYKLYAASTQFPIEAVDIHHSRCARLEGIALPYWQRVYENYWGMSIFEPLYDRLVAFDSGTQGAAQLLYRAYLRVIRMKDLREVIGAGTQTDAYKAILAHLDFIRKYQSSEGLTVLDAEDEFEAHSYGFGGISDVLLQLGMQLSGALQIPLVRLFGQSPAGLSATGESDIRNYYDGINQKQELQLRKPLDRIIRVIAASEGIKLPENFSFTFASLWQMDDKTKADVTNTVTTAIVAASNTNPPLIQPSTAMAELRKMGRITGHFDGISDKEIKDAENAVPLPSPDSLLAAANEEAANENEEDDEEDPKAKPKPKKAANDEQLSMFKRIKRAFTKDQPTLIAAAGTAIRAGDGTMLFVRRTDTGQWAFPGGRIEEGESAKDAAKRETIEETGFLINTVGKLADRAVTNGVDFSTFEVKVSKRFRPHLNDEHDEFIWAKREEAPQPLHPGVKSTLGL